MPNIVSQTVDSTGITIVASNGKTFFISPAQIKAQHATALGVKSAATAAIGMLIETTLGKEMVPASSIALDYDQVTGIPSLSSINAPNLSAVQIV
jgi:hypothetical protein